MRSSKAELPVTDKGAGYTLRETIWGGIRAEIDIFDKKLDMTPCLRDLPNGMDPVPHWGHVLKGQIRAIYTNHEEVFNEGDIFYIEPDHTTIFGTGTECLMFSADTQLRTAVEHIERARKQQE